MRIDLPQCSFKDCRKCFDGNCLATKEYREGCEYLIAQNELYSYRKAEEQGLLIKLPCKVGDTVWQTVIDVRKCKVGYVHYDIAEAELTRYCIDYFFPTFWTKAKVGGYENQLTFNAIGQTVFLTREAAEQALKGSVAE
jgi:hypothetical protein